MYPMEKELFREDDFHVILSFIERIRFFIIFTRSLIQQI